MLFCFFIIFLSLFLFAHVHIYKHAITEYRTYILRTNILLYYVTVTLGNTSVELINYH